MSDQPAASDAITAASGHSEYARPELTPLSNDLDSRTDIRNLFFEYAAETMAEDNPQHNIVMGDIGSVSVIPKLESGMGEDHGGPANAEVMVYEAAEKDDEAPNQATENDIIHHEAAEKDNEVPELAHSQNNITDPNPTSTPTFTTSLPPFNKTCFYTDLETLPSGPNLLAIHRFGQPANLTQSIVPASHSTAFALNASAPPHMHALICLYQWSIWANNDTNPAQQLRLQNWVQQATLQFLLHGGHLPNPLLAQAGLAPTSLDVGENGGDTVAQGVMVGGGATNEEFAGAEAIPAAGAAEAGAHPSPATTDPSAARRTAYDKYYLTPKLNALFGLLGQSQLRKPLTTWEKLAPRIRKLGFPTRLVQDLGREFEDGCNDWDGKEFEGLKVEWVDAVMGVLKTRAALAKNVKARRVGKRGRAEESADGEEGGEGKRVKV